jgi:tRNA threonylcarbamoyladenosine biosynthesis protein TsaB
MNNLFPILSIETTDKLCSAAILLNENDYYETNIQGKHVHSQKLIVTIDELLKSAGLEINEIKSLAVSEGPGSFTGLRIGMAAAKGIAVGKSIPLTLVPTFDALAFKISSYLSSEKKFCIIKKASKDESYFASYIFRDGNVEIVDPIQLILNENLTSYTDSYLKIFSDLDADDTHSDLTIPTARDIGVWAYKFGKDLLTSNYDFVEPKYLKEFKVRKSI